MIFRYLSEGFFLGLATGHLCLSTCGFIYFPYLMQHGGNWAKSLVNLLKISAGRFITYTLFGLGAGWLGREIGQFNRNWFTAVAYILLSIILFVSAFRTHRREKGCAASRWGRFADSPFLLGLVTGINFCPSFLIALTRAVDLSGPVSGAFLFMAFFFGTNIFLVPLAFFGVIANKKYVKIASIVASVGVGIWFTGQAGITIYKEVTAGKALRDDFDKGIIVSILDGSSAYLLTQDSTAFIVLRDSLIARRNGPVHIITDVPGLPDRGYVLVDQRWPAAVGADAESLKAPERFVIVLPRPARENDYGGAYAAQLTVFFDARYFKLDKMHGSFFNMGNSVFGGER